MTLAARKIQNAPIVTFELITILIDYITILIHIYCYPYFTICFGGALPICPSCTSRHWYLENKDIP
jgi:hypothetical protein